MIEILGNNLKQFFDIVDNPPNDAEITYAGERYEVWEVSDELHKKMCNMSEEEFIELVKSGDFSIIKETQLKDEGWEYNNGYYTNDDYSEDIDDSIFSLETFSIDDIEDIDMSDNTFRLGEDWYPMGIIEKEEHLIEPIKLDIPDYEEL